MVRPFFPGDSGHYVILSSMSVYYFIWLSQIPGVWQIRLVPQLHRKESTHTFPPPTRTCTYLHAYMHALKYGHSPRPSPQEVNFMIVKAGQEPATLLRSVQRLLSRIFVPAVRVNPSDLDTSPGSVSARDHLLAGLRSFASCLHGRPFPRL